METPRIDFKEDETTFTLDYSGGWLTLKNNPLAAVKVDKFENLRQEKAVESLNALARLDYYLNALEDKAKRPPR